jgi:lipoprotein-anchoring transpeptidase ErfK/SrfK
VWAPVAALGGLAALTGAVLNGCTSVAGSLAGGGAKPAAQASSALAITTPANGAKDVPTATEIAFAGADRGAATVALTDATGAPVAGTMRADRTAWIPAEQLKYGAGYTATVTAKSGGRSDVRTISFKTMSEPGSVTHVTTILQDNQVYGVGLPIVLRFDQPVPDDQRANVQRRLFVTSEPAQEGAWNWFAADEVHYRPKTYWQEGTKLSLRAATGGLPMGGNRYGAGDLTLHASIGDKILMSIDNATKTLTVNQHDQVVKQVPVSLGKPSHPTSSGNMVVMTKAQSELFVSTEPGESYRTTVYWTQRLTWGGEYLHAAPWSVGDQGVDNVSHGCTNMSTENAQWLFGLTHVGDPITIQGTEHHLDWGNGWTDWDRPWEEYLRGGALPYVPAGGR